jgi:hypothetical protein
MGEGREEDYDEKEWEEHKIKKKKRERTFSWYHQFFRLWTENGKTNEITAHSDPNTRKLNTQSNHYEVRAIALMKEAVLTSETSVNWYQSTRRYNPEDGHLQYIPLVFIASEGS